MSNCDHLQYPSATGTDITDPKSSRAKEIINGTSYILTSTQILYTWSSDPLRPKKNKWPATTTNFCRSNARAYRSSCTPSFQHSSSGGSVYLQSSGAKSSGSPWTCCSTLVQPANITARETNVPWGSGARPRDCGDTSSCPILYQCIDPGNWPGVCVSFWNVQNLVSNKMQLSLESSAS